MNIELNNFDRLESKVLELVRQLSRLKMETCEMKNRISSLEKELEKYKKNCFEINKKSEHIIEIERENKKLKSQRERLYSRIEYMLENIETVTGEFC